MHLKLKLEKVEKERNELRLTSDRLESRVRDANILFDLKHKAGPYFTTHFEKAGEKSRKQRFFSIRIDNKPEMKM